mgnify:CR=1 FL=1
MLSRTAHNLYWIGRYMERAEFTTRLIEATIRLSSLSGDSQADRAWRSALAVVGETEGFKRSGENLTAFNVARHLTLAEENSNSVRSCLYAARDNARAARNSMTREAWEAINRAWLAIRDRSSPGEYVREVRAGPARRGGRPLRSWQCLAPGQRGADFQQGPRRADLDAVREPGLLAIARRHHEPAPGEPKFARVGLARHHSTKSATLRTVAGTRRPPRKGVRRKTAPTVPAAPASTLAIVSVKEGRTVRWDGRSARTT